MPKLAITCGDPAGVGPEIIAAWLSAHAAESIDVAVIGPARWLATLPSGVERVAVGKADYVATPGVPDAEGARLAIDAMETAAAGCSDGRFAGVVTGPVSKAGMRFPGRPNFLRRGGEANR
jgi:4-hydroxythreonine-4-phosphate dehydrogenase